MADFGQFRGFSDNLFQGKIPSNLGIIGSINIGYILDIYQNAAAAYSLRQLRTAYTGSAIRVRRSSDNTEQNIGFTIAGDLDTSSLTSFCGSGNGFVTTWYDQSGNNNNATQTTAASQPQIVSSGNVLLDNGKPTLQFDGSNDVLLSTSSIDPLFITVVNKPNITTTFKTLFGADTSDAVNVGSIYFQYVTPTRIPAFARTTTIDTISADDFIAKGSTAVNNNTMNLMSGSRDNTNIQVYINNSQVGSDTTINSLRPVGGVNSGRFTLMAGYYNNVIADFLTGSISEFIAYNTNQSSNLTAINTNINTYYGIY
jgi:hypothetical protein